MVDNDNTISYDTLNYGIFLDSPNKWYLPKITSTVRDDDTNNDFIIDERDINLTSDIPEDKVWEFEFTSLFSTYLYDPDFSCWGNSISGEYEVCYSLGGGYNKFCDLNCTDEVWYYPYTINSSLNYNSDNIYGVTLVLGSISRNVASQTTVPFRFNPPVQETVDTMRGFILITITTLVILLFAVIILVLLLLVFPLFGIYLIFRRKKK